MTVVVELKARFDEEANINWAERLEAVGAQVVYGIVGFKTHAKLLLVTRREAGRRGLPVLRRYGAPVHRQLQPASTARLYTDLGMLTADPQVTADIRRGVPPARQPHQGAHATPPAHRALRHAPPAGAPGGAGGRGGPRRSPGAHRGEDQRLDRAGHGAGPGGRRPGRRRTSTWSCAAPACCRPACPG